MHGSRDHERRKRGDEPEAIDAAAPLLESALGPRQVLALQRSAGNKAVTRALQRKPLLGNDSGFQLGVRDAEFKIGKDGKVEPGSGGMSTSNARAKVPDFTASR